MKRRLPGLGLLLALVAGCLASMSAVAATSESKVTAKPVFARQTVPTVVLVGLPFVCFDSAAQARTWADTLRLYRVPGVAEAASGKELAGALATEVELALDEDGCTSTARVTSSAGALAPKAEYRLLTGPLETRNIKLEASALNVALRALAFELDRRNPAHLEVVSPVCLVPSGAPDCRRLPAAATVEMRGKSAQGDEVAFTVLEMRQLGGDPGPYRLQLVVDPPVGAGMSLTLTARDAAGGPLSGSTKVKFQAPKSKKEAEFFAQVTAEAGEGQKPNLLIDVKLDRAEAVALPGHWTLGMELGMELATRDSAETRKLHLAYPFTHTWIYALPGSNESSVGAVYTRFAPSIEADDYFASRNVLADLSWKLVSTALHRPLGVLPSGAKEDLRWRYSLVPTLGYQWGENQHLKDAKLAAFEGYTVSRGAAELSLELERKLPAGAAGRALSFSLTYSVWYRFDDELDTYTGDDGKSAVRLDDGFVDYLTATVDWSLSDAFGLVAKYQTGERPVLFKDEDKASLGVSYRF